MKVYLLEHDYHFEGSYILGVYATKEAAIRALNREVNERSTPYRQWRISEDELRAGRGHEDLIISEIEVQE